MAILLRGILMERANLLTRMEMCMKVSSTLENLKAKVSYLMLTDLAFTKELGWLEIDLEKGLQSGKMEKLMRAIG